VRTTCVFLISLIANQNSLSSQQNFTLRRVWRYQRGNQNPYIEEEQTTLWSKEEEQTTLWSKEEEQTTLWSKEEEQTTLWSKEEGTKGQTTIWTNSVHCFGYESLVTVYAVLVPF
jgi:hypothetical protein